MSTLISKFVVEPKTLFLYQKFHLNIFFLMCLFFYKMEGDKLNENKFRKLFSPDDFTDGYMDFIKTLYLIYLHADESHKKNKIQIKSDYIKIVKDLNYPYINIHFFNNYFK